jgi:hypothetical protein
MGLWAAAERAIASPIERGEPSRITKLECELVERNSVAVLHRRPQATKSGTQGAASRRTTRPASKVSS